MPTFYDRVIELKDETVQAFWNGTATLNKNVSRFPTFRKFYSHTFKASDLFLTFNFAWAVVCVAVVRYSQAQPFPLLSTLPAIIMLAVGLSIPMVSQFIMPATQIAIYIWTLYWVPGSYSIFLPFHLSTFCCPLLSIAIWLFGPSHCLQYFSFLTGYTNLVVVVAYITLEYTWVPPAKLPFNYETVFAGINTGLQAVFLDCFFPRYLSVTTLFCVLCFLHGGLQEKVGFLFGVGVAMKCFLYFLPNELRKNYETSPLLSSLFASNTIDDIVKINNEGHDNAIASVTKAVADLDHDNWIDGSAYIHDMVVAPCQIGQDRGKNAVEDAESIRPSLLSISLENTSLTLLPPDHLGKAKRKVTDVSEVFQTRSSSTPPANLLVTITPSQCNKNSEEQRDEEVQTLSSLVPPLPFITGKRNSGEDRGGDFPQFPSQSSKPIRRRSVVGPREHQKLKTSHRSLDVNIGRLPRRQLPTPPLLPSQAGNAVIRRHSFLSSPAVQARWDDSFFEMVEKLGESSSRITFKVREKRSGLLFVRKTFHPCQTSGHYIKMALLKLIDLQESGCASPNVVRCFGTYLSNNIGEGVRGIFEFCEEGSLLSIGRTIARRGGVVGEKIIGRLAEGVRGKQKQTLALISCISLQMLQGLCYLHFLGMVHHNVRPSNVFFTRLGVVKLSEPEIPGEEPVALTDRFTKTVRYASVSFVRRAS